MGSLRQQTQPEERLSIRANADQKSVLRRAADARHTTMSQFVLEASLNEASRILAEESVLKVSAEEYEWLCKLMDDPPRELPKLKELANRKPVWDA
jgi:uncharacterized protein (DUF1778 family)